MTIKFEWQFKYRDESNVNAALRRDPAKYKKYWFGKGLAGCLRIPFTLRLCQAVTIRRDGEASRRRLDQDAPS
jgi:hypothetical protein